MKNLMSQITGLTGAGVRQARKFSVLAIIALFLCWPMSLQVRAAAGDLDQSFGNGGRVMTDFFGDVDDLKVLLIQGDGRIIAAGTAFGLDHNLVFALARYNPNGSLDQGFGVGGKVTTEIAPTEILSDAVLQPDGKLVISGYILTASLNLDLVVARYNTDGSLDPTFGTGGIVITDFSGGDEASFAIAIQSDGKIVVGTSGFGLVRYNPNGSLDLSFGNGGRAFANFLSPNSGLFDVVIQADGKIVASGFAVKAGEGSRFALARFNPDGSLDPGFGIGGKITTDFAGDEEWATVLALQPDGKIIAAGRSGSLFVPPRGLLYALARYNTDGSLDTSFGVGGTVSTRFISDFSEIKSIALQSDGKILVGGDVLARYNSNGSLDTSFGVSGFVRNLTLGIALQSDGKIVTGGTVDIGETRDELTRDFLVSRFDSGLGSQSFDHCIQDESNGGVFQFNSTTGDYQFTNCSGLTTGGIGFVTQRGGIITLQHTAADRRVLARIVTPANKATATIQLFSQGTTFTITDRNTSNNTCACR